ncbi:hypothetical protein HR12_10610 [Microbacterium sp. SUBG005]|nr:hypothetical protein HR12_10610 [Microbacterium sp. SUBG005]
MTAALGQSADPARLIPGNAAALHRTAALWRARADDAEESAARLRQLRAVPEWAGDAADAYDRRVSVAASRWDAMASAFRAAQAALEEFAAALEAARARAGDAVDLWNRADALDAAVPSAAVFPGPDRQPLRSLEPRSEARSILDDARSALDTAAERAASALRQAIATPGLDADEWLAVLTGSISPSQTLDAIAGADGTSLARLLRARPALAEVLAQAEPSAVAPWWAALNGAQKEALIHTAPAVIGNLGGVAYVARDEANHIWLRTQLGEARAALAEAEKPPSVRELLGGFAGATAIAERLERAQARVEGLEGIEASLVVPEGKAPRFLTSLTADTPPLAAVSIGDLDSAGDVTFAVPGMGTTTEGMDGWVRAAQNIADEQARFDPERAHAVVAWIGYKTPPIPFIEGGLDVMFNDSAEAGAVNLARDLIAFDTVNGGVDVNVVAHSYGTTTSSLALTREGVHVESYVTLGSAGLPPAISNASVLHADAVYSGQARDVWAIDPAGGDQWAWTGRAAPDHSVNPMGNGFGSHPFSVAGGQGLNPVTDHGAVTSNEAGYLDRRTESLRNVALATTGHGDLVSLYTAPDSTPFQKALIEGLSDGPTY